MKPLVVVLLLSATAIADLHPIVEMGTGYFFGGSAESDVPNVYEIPAVLDLNGDGKLEVIVHSQYYEGAATTIYDCSRRKVQCCACRLVRVVTGPGPIGGRFSYSSRPETRRRRSRATSAS